MKKIQRVPTAATTITSNAMFLQGLRIWLARKLINLGLWVGGISFKSEGNPTRQDKRRLQFGR